MVTKQPKKSVPQVNGGRLAQATGTRAAEALQAIQVLAAYSAPVIGVATGAVGAEPILVSGGKWGRFPGASGRRTTEQAFKGSLQPVRPEVVAAVGKTGADSTRPRMQRPVQAHQVVVQS
jgi:hypothetical protein